MPRVAHRPLPLKGWRPLRRRRDSPTRHGAPRSTRRCSICHALTGDAHVARHEPATGPAGGTASSDRPGDRHGPPLRRREQRARRAATAAADRTRRTGADGVLSRRSSVDRHGRGAAPPARVRSASTRLRLVIGGSLGGHAGARLGAVEEPAPQRVVAIGAADRLPALQVAICHAQHVAIELGLSPQRPRRRAARRTRHRDDDLPLRPATLRSVSGAGLRTRAGAGPRARDRTSTITATAWPSGSRRSPTSS